jgi:hypothetical protein
MSSKSALRAGLGKRDANHAELAQLYEQLGCSVVDTHTLGFPPVRLVRNSQDVIEHVTEIRRAIRRARV